MCLPSMSSYPVSQVPEELYLVLKKKSVKLDFIFGDKKNKNFWSHYKEAEVSSAANFTRQTA